MPVRVSEEQEKESEQNKSDDKTGTELKETRKAVRCPLGPLQELQMKRSRRMS